MTHVGGHIDGYNDHLYPKEQGGHVGAGYNIGPYTYSGYAPDMLGTSLGGHLRNYETTAGALPTQREYGDAQRAAILRFYRSGRTEGDENALAAQLETLYRAMFPNDPNSEVLHMINADMERVRAGTHDLWPTNGGNGGGNGGNGGGGNGGGNGDLPPTTDPDAPPIPDWYDPREIGRRGDLYGGFLQRQYPQMGRYAGEAARDRFADVQAQYFLQPGVFGGLGQTKLSFLDYLQGGQKGVLGRGGQRARLGELSDWWTQSDDPTNTLQMEQMSAVDRFRGDMAGSAFNRANIPFLAALQPALAGVAPAARGNLMSAASRFLTRLRERQGEGEEVNFLQALRDRGFF